MQRTEKEEVVAALVEQLRSTESLIVADYRGLTNADLVELRARNSHITPYISLKKNFG